jgi:plastocyanin
VRWPRMSMRSAARRVERLGPLPVSVLLLLSLSCGEAPAPQTADAPVPEILDQLSRPGDGGAVHLVRLVQRGDQYAFEPAELSIPSGDVLRFVMTGQQPESVAFDTTAAAPEVADFIGENSLLRGVLLVQPGQAHDVSFRDAPPGRYSFYSIPHSVHGMRGWVDIR